MKKTFGIIALLLTAFCGSYILMACGGDDGDSGNDSGSGSSSGTTSEFIPTNVPARTLAFPGADGGAKNITGGAGGSVYVVTSLSDDNVDGTLRYGLTKVSGKRTIIFAVSGIIEMKQDLNITNGDVTVAGQTAPGDGICLKNYGVNINASNVILRYLRFRMGDEKATEADALSSSHHDNAIVSDIMIDHCSISWSTDECASFYGNKNFTMQYCIISESLRISVHDKGKHGYGGIWGGENATFHHNLLAHHDSRNPRFDHDYVSTQKGPVHFVNNVIYNWGGNSAYGGESKEGSTAKAYNMVNNYYKSGPASSHKYRILNPTTSCSNCNNETGVVVPGQFYITGNYVYGSSANTSDNWKGVEPASTSYKLNAYVGTANSWVETAEQAFESVLNYAGASYKRDAVDARVVKETREGSYTYKGSQGSTNGLIDSQKDVGGWPTYNSTAALTDSDKDGMPDEWEQRILKENGWESYGIQKFRPNGYNLSAQYTNLEVYLNDLVKGTFPSGAGADKIK
jgi:hypothetical protein